VRDGLIKAVPRTQESISLSPDGDDWFLINASPDIRSQIESFRSLHPKRSRGSAIQAIFLTNGDLDHCLGLLSLRENHHLVIYSTDSVRRGFTEGNVLYRTLQRFADQVTWRTLKLDVEEIVLCADGRPSNLTVKAVPLPGKPPIHLDGVASPHDHELNVGFRFRDCTSGRVLAYLSSVGRITPGVLDGIEGVDCLLFDGTFWSSDELSAPGYLPKSAQDLAHWPVGGSDGSLTMLSKIAVPRRLFIHLNNTNPMLREDSAERKLIEAAGWEVAWDGMEVQV
jgi:pyrroloquinoline quinone biosynthesis protein B